MSAHILEISMSLEIGIQVHVRRHGWFRAVNFGVFFNIYEYLHLLLQHTRFKPDASHRPLIPWFPFLFVFMNSKITKLLKSRTYQRNYVGNCGHHHACRWSTTAGFCICKKLTVDGDINNTSIIWSLYLRAWAVHRHDRNKYIPHVNCF